MTSIRWRLPSLLCLVVATGPVEAQRRTSSPTYEQIGALIQSGLDSLGRGDTMAYLRGTGQAFALAPRVPPVAYHHARALALAGGMDSAPLSSTGWPARRGRGVRGGGRLGVRPAPGSPRWKGVAARIEATRRPISTSVKAFELAERDLTAEGTAWDAKTGRLFLGSLYKRKIVAISRRWSSPRFHRLGTGRHRPRRRHRGGSRPAGALGREHGAAGGGDPAGRHDLLAHGLLFHYDVDTGRLRRRYVLPPPKAGGTGFNDVTVLPNGDVYITDSQAGGVYLAPAGGAARRGASTLAPTPSPTASPAAKTGGACSCPTAPGWTGSRSPRGRRVRLGRPIAQPRRHRRPRLFTATRSSRTSRAGSIG